MAVLQRAGRPIRRARVHTVCHALAQAKYEYDAVKAVDTHQIDGDILEAGVWRGGSSCVMACAHLQHVQEAGQLPLHPRRDQWLFDTFDGMWGNSSNDPANANSAMDLVSKGGLPAGTFPRWVQDNKWNYGPQEVVEQTLARTGYPPARTHLVKGPVEHTLRNETLRLPTKLAVLRLDTDFFDSTRVEHVRTATNLYLEPLARRTVSRHAQLRLAGHRMAKSPGRVVLTYSADALCALRTTPCVRFALRCSPGRLEVLWPRLQPGGWLCVDDYYVWSGAKKAVDEWLKEHNWAHHARSVGAFGMKGGHKMRNWLFKAVNFTDESPFMSAPARGSPS